MRILLSNDDGCHATGLTTLRKGLEGLGEHYCVAPDADRSGASHAVTLLNPLRLQEHAPNVYSVNGTPADCVHLGLTAVCNPEPDIVISGINAGENLGSDVLYSGTVAAAMEARHLAYPPIAVSGSVPSARCFESAVNAVRKLLEQLPEMTFEKGIVLNVNVPDLSWPDIRGFKITRLGNRAPPKPAIRSEDARGADVFWVGPVGDPVPDDTDTDFAALRQGYISVTPLHADLTCHTSRTQLQEQLGDLL